MKKFVFGCFVFALAAIFVYSVVISAAPPKKIPGFTAAGKTFTWDHDAHSKGPGKKCPDCHKGGLTKEKIPANMKDVDKAGCYTGACHEKTETGHEKAELLTHIDAIK